jgi:hypothetical protein
MSGLQENPQNAENPANAGKSGRSNPAQMRLDLGD